MIEDLIFEIFTRLPSKSLVRCTLISKSYSSLISSPEFTRQHTLRSPQKLLIRHYYHGFGYGGEFYTLHSEKQLPLSPETGYNGVTLIEFPYMCCPVFRSCKGILSRSERVIGSCNGILCLLDLNRIILWNPSIRRVLTLTIPVRNPLQLSTYGFGFDPITNDYKIVSIWQGKLAPNPMVYTIRTRTWVEIASPIPSYYILSYQPIVVNGVMHWVIRVLGDNKQLLILTFNMSCHVFGTIELPEEIRNWREEVNILSIRESLAVISYCGKSCRIWVYNNGESWAKMMKLEIPSGLGSMHLASRMMTDGNFLFITDGPCFTIYNPVTGVYSGFVNFGTSLYLGNIEQYKESIGLLNEGTSCY